VEGVTPAEPRRMRLTGLHHLTAIVRDLDRTTAFYSGVLGLQLVKEGTSDDDAGARHFWFAFGGDSGTGSQPPLVSFMEYPALQQATVGIGAVQHFAFIVESAEEQQAWVDYLRGRGVQCTDVFERGGFRSIYLRDPDEHIVEIATRGPGLVPGPAQDD
jgi:glyoxylase I family protein